MALLNLTDDLDFLGSNLIITDEMNFPSNPKNGEFAFVDGALHIYGSVDNVITWYPLTSRQQYWIHAQNLPSDTWVVEHNLGTTELLFMVYDNDSVLAYDSHHIISENAIQISFPEATLGTVVIFASNEARMELLEQKTTNIEAALSTKADTDTTSAMISEITDLQNAVATLEDTAIDSPTEVLTKIKEVDGAGSGLDADLFDGHDSDYFAVKADIYTKTEVDTVIADVIGAAPSTLDTLNELAAALNDDPDFAASITTSLGYKLDSADYTAEDVLAKIKSVDGVSSGLDADLLDGNQGSYYTDWNNLNNKPSPTIALGGDASGSLSLTDMQGGTLTVTVKDDSHNHTIANVDGLQTVLNGKLSVTGTAVAANKLATSRTLSLAGDVSGSVSFDGTSNVTITATVANNSHTHTIANVTGLQTALDNKLSTSGKAADSNLLDGIDSSAFLRSDTTDSKTAGTLTFNDNVILALGSGNDCELFCNGTNAYMDLNSGIGNFYIRDGSTTRFTFDDAGHFTASGNVTAYSDARVKTNLEVIPEALDKISQINGYTFDRTDVDTGKRETGVLAQELEKVLPEAVLNGETDEDLKSVAYGNVIGLLIEGIKELQAEVNELRSQVLG